MQSKLGLHIIRGIYPAYTQNTRPGVVKLVGDWGQAENVAEGTLVIGRLHNSEYDAQLQYQVGMSPADAALQFVGDQLPTYDANSAIVYWEGHNEPVWNHHEEMAWYAQFEVERMKLMADIGRKCVIGNFSTGAPALDLWTSFVPACVAGWDYEAILGLHEYSCPWMWWMTGNYQIDPSEDEGDEGWTTLRYRKVYRNYLIPAGAAIPLLMTECGIDPLVRPQPDVSPGGTWKQLGNFWRDHDGEGDEADYYFRQLVWYDTELQKDPYVVGAAIFCFGNFGPPWSDFDVAGTDVETLLTGYAQQNPAAPFVYPTDTPEPPPGPLPDEPPRIDFERYFILMFPDAEAKWMVEAALATNEDKRTLGHSADDAGYGPLSKKTAVIINRDRWNADIEAFFAEHYPSVTLVFLTAASPAELFYALQDRVEFQHVWMRDPAWANINLGGPLGSETIGTDGCILSNLCMLLQDKFGYAALPPSLNRLMHEAGAYHDDDLVEWDTFADLFTALEWEGRSDRGYNYTVDEIQALLDSGRAVIAAILGWSHYVYVVGTTYNSILCHDAWYDNGATTRLVTDVCGLRVYRAADSLPIPPLPQEFPILGIHGEGGGQHLVDQGVGGWCVVPIYLNEDPKQLNYSHLADQGIRVIANLRRSFSSDCGGEGTIPPPSDEGRTQRFIDNILTTLSVSKGLWGASICNEANNPREWPVEGDVLRPEHVLRVFNAVYPDRPEGIHLGLGAPDPFYGPGSNVMDWWYHWMNYAVDVDAIYLHGYTRGANADWVTDLTRFSDDPLRWQGVNYFECVRTLLGALPGRFQQRPVIVTEFNHIHKRDEMFPNPMLEEYLGWRDDPAAVVLVEEAARIAQAEPYVVGLVLYRWSGDAWELERKHNVLDAVRRINTI